MRYVNRLFSVNFDEGKSTDYLTSLHRRMLAYGNILVFAGFGLILISSSFTNIIADQTFVGLTSLCGLMIASSSRYYNTARKIEDNLKDR